MGASRIGKEHLGKALHGSAVKEVTVQEKGNGFWVVVRMEDWTNICLILLLLAAVVGVLVPAHPMS